MIAQVIVDIADENIEYHSSEKLMAVQLPPDVERSHRLDDAGIRKRRLVFSPIGAQRGGIQQAMCADIVLTSAALCSVKPLDQKDGPAGNLYQFEIRRINAGFVGQAHRRILDLGNVKDVIGPGKFSDMFRTLM